MSTPRTITRAIARARAPKLLRRTAIDPLGGTYTIRRRPYDAEDRKTAIRTFTDAAGRQYAERANHQITRA